MRQYEDGRAFAQKKDSEDKLAKFQERFYKLENTIYMDGNSLGLCSKDAEACLMEALDVWKKAGNYTYKLRKNHNILPPVEVMKEFGEWVGLTPYPMTYLKRLDGMQMLNHLALPL